MVWRKYRGEKEGEIYRRIRKRSQVFFIITHMLERCSWRRKYWGYTHCIMRCATHMMQDQEVRRISELDLKGKREYCIYGDRDICDTKNMEEKR